MGIEGGDGQALEAKGVAEHVSLLCGIDARPEVGEGAFGRGDREAVEGRGVEDPRLAYEEGPVSPRAAGPLSDDDFEAAFPRAHLVGSSGAREGQDAAWGGEGGGPPSLQARDRSVAGHKHAVVQPPQIAGPVTDRVPRPVGAAQLPAGDATLWPGRQSTQNVLHQVL